MGKTPVAMATQRSSPCVEGTMSSGSASEFSEKLWNDTVRVAPLSLTRVITLSLLLWHSSENCSAGSSAGIGKILPNFANAVMNSFLV